MVDFADTLKRVPSANLRYARANHAVFRATTSATAKGTDGSQCLLLVGRGGFEPPKSKTSDLQSDPFGRSGICPCIQLKFGAGDRNRTNNLLITNQLLCRLSYTGISPKGNCRAPQKIAFARFFEKRRRGRFSKAFAVGERLRSSSRADDVVPWGGIEPPTDGFSVRCSTI